MKKVVVKVDLHDEKQKQKAMSKVSCLTGIDSIEMNMKDKKLTVVGDVDPVDVVKKLKKYWCTEILTVGPAKEEKKKDDKKDDKKKDDKKDDKKKDDPWKGYCPPPTYYYIPIHEDNPNSCAIL